ncbi:MAG: DUF6702 family protein [Planctomycetota bacterium]
MLTWTLIFASPAFASHPYHVSLTEMEWNEQSGKFEVALCVWPADLEQALRLQEGRPIDLDAETDLDDLLTRFVESGFQVTQENVAPEHKQVVTALAAAGLVISVAEKKTGRIQWAGYEINNKEAWLYFEVAGLNNPEHCQIENHVMFELNDDQMNHVNFTAASIMSNVVCTPDQRRKSLMEGAVRGVVRY